MVENMLGQSYGVLKRHLASLAADGRPGRRPNKAKHKLVQLTPLQFMELSRDVCDELLRRMRYDQWRKHGGAAPEPPSFLPAVEDIHPKRNQARKTLSELPEERFQVLSTDVFFEIERRVPRFPGGDIGRGGSPASMRGPPSRSGTPIGRPGSRDQMRRPPRQNSLGSQVLAGAGIPEVNDYRPMPKSSQANTMVPNKSYLVEDDDDHEGSVYNARRQTAQSSGSYGSEKVAEYQGKVHDLEIRVEDLQKQLEVRDATIQRLESSHGERESEKQKVRRLTSFGNALTFQTSAEWLDLRAGLEAKLVEAQHLNESMRAELERLHTDHDLLQTDHDQLQDDHGKLQSDHDQLQDNHGRLQDDHDRLQDDHGRIQDEHGERERDLTQQIGLLTQNSDADGQLRARHDALQSGHDALQTRHGDLERDNESLRQELHEQQGATEEVRAELAMFVAEVRNMSERSEKGWQRAEALQRTVRDLEEELQKGRAALIITPPMPAEDVRPDGVIAEQHVTEFRAGVDELLRAAHAGEALDPKPVVVAVKSITEDAPGAPPKLKARVAATANNFVTAAQNFAHAPRISPVSLLDAAASHLASSIIELVRTVGLREADTPEEEDDFDVGAYNDDVQSSVNGRSSASESIYSLATATTAMPGHRKQASAASARLPSTSYQQTHTRGPSVNGASHPEANEELAELKV